MLPQKLDRGGIDVVLNGYEWSKEREQSWSSTIPYYIYKLQLMARKDDASIRSWDDLRAKQGKAQKQYRRAARLGRGALCRSSSLVTPSS